MYQGIEAKIALRGIPYVSPLVGVVLESQTGVLKGMLVELPSKGPTFYFDGGSQTQEQANTVAKQIVRGIAAFHEQRHVVGALRVLSWSICINEHDDVMIVSGVHAAHPGTHSGHGQLPPEYRIESFLNGEGQIKPEFDIFQLGSILWHLYRDQDLQRRESLCTLAGCDNANRNACIEHENPIALTRAAANIPQYLDRVIALCRQQHPNDRPAAWELIEMFPSDKDILKQIDDLKDNKKSSNRDDYPAASRARLRRLEAVRALYDSSTSCDACNERRLEVYYHCETCGSGNFDLCQACFLKGLQKPSTLACESRTCSLRKP
jgi:hypothetical protein